LIHSGQPLAGDRIHAATSGFLIIAAIIGPYSRLVCTLSHTARMQCLIMTIGFSAPLSKSGLGTATAMRSAMAGLRRSAGADS
jgi:hypothetical protein